ncbi:MAG: sugar-binding protein, partial [Bacillota bacterium]|nr:sugar-binding protein [Bacillota bacterium]
DVTSECDNSDEEDVIVSDDEDSDESSIDEDAEENADEDAIDENVGEDTEPDNSEDANTFDEENNFENDEQRSNDYPDDILNEDGLMLLEAENHEDVSATANNGHPIIDNEIDEIWNDTECINLERYNGVTDSAASARILWDDEAIYFRVNISDDTADYLSDDLENRDAVEIFIDEDLSDLNEKETIHFSIDRSNNLIVNGEIDEKEGISHCVSDNSDGYSVEISYKWKNAGYKLGKEIRADIKVNDSDEENIQGTINWSDENANSSLDSSLWGKVILEEQFKDEVVVTVEDALYVGKAVTPAVKVVRNGEELTYGVDYTLKYLNNIRTAKKPEDGYSASAPTVVITGKGDYTSIIRANFSILPADFSTQADSFYVSYANNIKSSVVALKPTVAIKYNGLIVNASQFVVKYRKYDFEALLDSIPAESYGDYYIVVSASPKGLFTGKKEFPLHIINRKQKYASSFTIGVIKSKVYTGNPIELSTEKNGKAAPEIWVKDGKTLLSPGIDYSISYEDNKRVGKAKVIITGKGNYLGSVTRYFNITGIPVSKFKIVLPHDHDYTDVGKWWTGSPITFTE